MSAETASPGSSIAAHPDTAASQATFAALAEAKGVEFPLHTERLSLSLPAPSDSAGLWSYWQLPETHSPYAAETMRAATLRQSRSPVRCW
ncbi:hypothetical protein [Brevibacterium sp. UBA7493]|uniref:hypothetical protein n=1 Tax=Brevibacterium sp. UBA7493 TaxID=1946121 RepID=UPI0025807704|nr:hypothetical protein [Brevibacterium sp. UBA7493]